MALDSEKELEQLKSRLRDLADKSYRQNIYTFTGFLGLAELDIYHRMEKELSFSHPSLYGGDEQAERQIVRFGSPQDLGYEEEFPIACIHVEPLIAKFSDDLTHRDFLGALMNLGIERSCIGDIRVWDRQGYLYCLRTMAEFICENLSQIRHTRVKCVVAERMENARIDEPRSVEIQVESERLDACLSRVYHISRSESLNLFAASRVYVDGMLAQNNSRLLKPGETVNVRGFGKFIYRGVRYETKKGKLCLEIGLFG